MWFSKKYNQRQGHYRKRTSVSHVILDFYYNSDKTIRKVKFKTNCSKANFFYN